MHLAGFEPAVSILEADYESDAFGHLATDALVWSWWDLNPRPFRISSKRSHVLKYVFLVLYIIECASPSFESSVNNEEIFY